MYLLTRQKISTRCASYEVLSMLDVRPTHQAFPSPVTSFSTLLHVPLFPLLQRLFTLMKGSRLMKGLCV